MAFSALLNASLIAFFLAVSTKTSLVLVGACSDWSALQNTKTGLAQQRNALLESSFLNDNFERLFTNSTSSYLPENETKLAQNKLAILEKIISLVSLSEKLSEIGNRRNKTITMKILLDAIIQDSCQYVSSLLTLPFQLTRIGIPSSCTKQNLNPNFFRTFQIHTSPS